MVNEFLIKQTIKVFTTIVRALISPTFKSSEGGATIRTVRQSLERLEKKQGSLSRERIVDYFICSLYAFKNRGNEWTMSSVLGPKSLERYLKCGKENRYYEDRWLASENLTRDSLLGLIADKSSHPQAQYVYMPMEESTKSRLFNTEAGYIVCQSSTLGWSPESASCRQCKFVEKCKIETKRKYPEIFRLRIEYDT